jgi:hypothetical protein
MALWKVGTEVLVKAGPFAGWRAAVVEDQGTKLRVTNGNTTFLVARKDVQRIPKG